MPADVHSMDSGVALGGKCLAAIPHPITAVIPIHPFNPVSLAVTIAKVTGKNGKYFNFYC